MTERRQWTEKENDQLLDLWFRGFGKKEIGQKLNCSIDAVGNQVWKIITGYRDFLNYQPKNRTWREGRLTRREIKAVLSGMMGEGKERGVSIEHLAKVMMREPEELEKQIRNAHIFQERGAGFGVME